MIKFLRLIIIVSVFSASTCYAKEPLNLAIAKQAVMQYHDSGEYLADIDQIIKRARSDMDVMLAHRNPDARPFALVLDIDETCLSNYASMVRLNFGGTLLEIRQDEDKGKDPVITPTLALYNYAKANHVAVFFITGRYAFERQVTIKNLRQAGFNHWDGLIFRSKQYEKTSASIYKTAMRKALNAKGYDIIMNIGDQESDLSDGYADKTYKLPNPFYLIP